MFKHHVECVQVIICYIYDRYLFRVNFPHKIPPTLESRYKGTNMPYFKIIIIFIDISSYKHTFFNNKSTTNINLMTLVSKVKKKTALFIWIINNQDLIGKLSRFSNFCEWEGKLQVVKGQNY